MRRRHQRPRSPRDAHPARLSPGEGASRKGASTHWSRGCCDPERCDAGRSAPGAGLPITSICRKRPFTTHADRLRPRLKGRRLPVAGPAARRAAGRGRRRRPRLPRRRVRRPRRPAGARQLPARAPDGRRARRLEARPSLAVPWPTWSTPCRTCRPAAWACGCSPAKATQIDLETHRTVFTWVQQRLVEAGRLTGKTIAIDATTLEDVTCHAVP